MSITRSPRGTIRLATPADAEAIAAIYNASVMSSNATLDTRPVTPSIFADQAVDPHHVVFVAELDGVVVGWSRIRPWSHKYGYRISGETSVFIDRAHRRRGFGRRLKQALTEHAPTKGYRHLVARIWADNDASIALNTALGYEMVGVQRQVGVAGGKWVDVAIMQRIVEETPMPE